MLNDVVPMSFTGQDAGKMLLAIEARIGQLLPSREEIREMVKKNLAKSNQNRKTRTPHTGASVVKLYEPHSKAESRHRSVSRRIAENPDLVAQVIAEARANGDILTKGAVLNAVSYEKEKTRKGEPCMMILDFAARCCCYPQKRHDLPLPPVLSLQREIGCCSLCIYRAVEQKTGCLAQLPTGREKNSFPRPPV